MAGRRTLHFVFKIGDRNKTIDFYKNFLGMKVGELQLVLWLRILFRRGFARVSVTYSVLIFIQAYSKYCIVFNDFTNVLDIL